ncbi:MAG: Trk family potassium uptake protein [Candidatus Hydrothermota bacterium]|nr:MAG: Trk family potassium uptake protein [Candidatus Hydrothermae bacterium]
MGALRPRTALKKVLIALSNMTTKFWNYISMTLSRSRILFRATRKIQVWFRRSNPAKLLILGYLTIASVGAFLLSLPIATGGKPIRFIDAFFTSTSALCVTGLIVKDTPQFFSFFGELVILILIFIGGLGYMTLGYFFLTQLRSKLTVKKLVLESFPGVQVGDLMEFVLRIVRLSLTFQLIGAVLLYIAFLSHGIPVAQALWHSIFNSVSAYCNAGFSTFSTSLTEFKGDYIVNIVVMSLIVIGGLGFVVLEEVWQRFRGGSLPVKKKLSLHTKVVFLWTTILIIVGFVFILFQEWDKSFSGLSLREKILASLFQSITPRTAGFNTVPISDLTPGTHLLLLIFMFIGGSPTGTAGGIKTTTFAALFMWLLAYLKGKRTVAFSGHRLPDSALRRGIAIFFGGLLYVMGVTLLIFIVERANAKDFIPYMFEVISAFGTVGLSFGLSGTNTSLVAGFTDFGKTLIIITMFVGKVGVLSAMAAIISREYEYYRYPEGKYIVG